ncbi:MAG: hypothetical protein K0Q95_1252 [Bacteroidota bacterium]|jgi:hypothetical protein|nr:hypothetical protein [Bacteroidota bacterium]
MNTQRLTQVLGKKPFIMQGKIYFNREKNMP